MRSPASVVVGNQGIIAATMATLSEFPDRTLLGEDVIWTGTDDAGMLSSHRLLSTATHLGDGVYGRATGKQLRYRILADCFAAANQITDEWLVRDQGAIVRQLGWEPKDYARDLIGREGGPEACVKPLSPATDRDGPYAGGGNDDEWGTRYADILTRIMCADLATIPREYDRTVQAEYPGGVTAHSHGAVDRFWMGLRASFPSAEFRIDHRIGRDHPLMPPRAALRWSLTCKHDGWGVFGSVTQFWCSLLRDDDEPGAKEVEVGATVHLPRLQAVDLAFRLPVGPALTERSSDGLNVGAKSSGEGRQHAGIRLRQPIRQLLGTPVANHLGKALCQVA